MDFLTSLYLNDVFLHILIHKSCRKFLRFVWNGRYYQFRVLLFGLSLSRQTFAKVLRLVLSWAPEHGIRLVEYFDDLLILGEFKKKFGIHTTVFQNKLTDLGLLIYTEKPVIILRQLIVA
ncbi:hypothetical protein AYI69_g7046 [Smittium culicis]|uniref:Reverse transcriptase domain-containing protein n=1 Tax=Smittium culicis TaxID=133412 RepID=A0A1R1XUV3_9FUNG|nr:hypothetical protein AYI69_g7046 [Smittium culicis]